MIRTLPTAPYSVAETAHVLGLGQDTVRGLIKRGELKGAFRAGAKLWRVPVAAVEDYLTRKRIA